MKREPNFNKINIRLYLQRTCNNSSAWLRKESQYNRGYGNSPFDVNGGWVWSFLQPLSIKLDENYYIRKTWTLREGVGGSVKK